MLDVPKQSQKSHADGKILQAVDDGVGVITFTAGVGKNDAAVRRDDEVGALGFDDLAQIVDPRSDRSGDARSPRRPGGIGVRRRSRQRRVFEMRSILVLKKARPGRRMPC